MKLVTLKEVRLNGEDVPAGVEVIIPDDLVKDWLRLGLAALPEEVPAAAPAPPAIPAQLKAPPAKRRR